VLKGVPGNGFDPEAIYRREAPGVVTVISYFGGAGPTRALGSGFVIDGKGEIATNAHVVLENESRPSARAREVYVQFADGNQLRARIVGTDPNADAALLRIDGGGVTLRRCRSAPAPSCGWASRWSRWAARSASASPCRSA
jgi:S1-C subfamily serine protease